MPRGFGGMEVVRQRHDRRACFGHYQAGIFSLRRLPVEICHCPGVPGVEPPIERVCVRIRIEASDADGVESQFESHSLQLGFALHTPLLDAPLLDAVLLDASRLQSRIVSRLHRANLTTSSSGGTA